MNIQTVRAEDSVISWWRSLRLNVRYRVALFFLFTNTLGSALLTSYVHPLFEPLIFLWPTIVGYYFLSLRCPSCQTRILLRSTTIADVPLVYWSARFPKQCRACGTSLR